MTRMLTKSVAGGFLRLNRAAWKRLPVAVRESRVGCWYGRILHRVVRRYADRQQFFGTFFLRNRPELEQVLRVVQMQPPGATVDIAILGCSTGAEVYSVLWTLRRARPDLKLKTHAVDISAEILAVAQKAVYRSESSELLGRSIFERLTSTELQEMFDWSGDQATVKPWIRADVAWHLCDAADPAILQELGPQHIVMASNFLCHMPPSAAEKCLRNIARLVKPGGHLFVLGVDLEVREKVAADLGWQPLRDMIREIHDGDSSVRRDWPWEWWGLEPINHRRHDWQFRYAVAYRLL